MLSRYIVELSGWVPAVIFPSATLMQLIKIVRERSVEGISVITWILFGIANIGLYIYAEKYLSFQSVAGLLGTAVIDFLIAGFTYSISRKQE